MKEHAAIIGIKIAAGISCVLSFFYVFVDQRPMLALSMIYAFFVALYLIKNPKLMLAKNFDEFGEEYDKSAQKHLLWGSPYFHGIVLAAFAIIYFVD